MLPVAKGTCLESLADVMQMFGGPHKLLHIYRCNIGVLMLEFGELLPSLQPLTQISRTICKGKQISGILYVVQLACS